MYNRKAANMEINFFDFPKVNLILLHSASQHFLSIYYRLGSVLGYWMIRQDFFFFWNILYAVHSSEPNIPLRAWILELRSLNASLAQLSCSLVSS